MSNLTKAKGLRTFGNELILEDGYLEVADNCNIDELGVIQNRRGFREYGDELSDSNATVDQLMIYKDRIFRHWDGNLEFDNGFGVFSQFSGTYNETQAGLRIKYQEAKGNLFFTTDEGIKKISATSSDQFSTAAGYITDAGIARATDIEATIVPETGGFLPPQSKCAYRVLWGIRDTNNNLLLGAPSERFVLTNSSEDSALPEQFDIAFSGTAETDLAGNYILFSTSSTDYVLWWSNAANNTEPQTSETLARTYIEVDIDGFGATTSSLVNATANAIADISLYSVNINGTTIEVTSTEDGTDIVDASAATEAGFIPANLTVTTVSQGQTVSGTFANADVTFSVPSDITDTAYFYQLYRTTAVEATSGLTLNDIDPGDEMNLVFETNLTDAEIIAGEVTVNDITTETFRASGAFLYTNPNSGQGILQSNNRPPIATDVELFRSTMFYSNTKTKHRKQIDVLSTLGYTSGVSSIIIGNSSSAREYVFVGAQEITDITCDTVANTTADSWIEIYSANDERAYYVWFDKGGGTDPAVANKISVRVDLSSITTAAEVSAALTSALNLTGDFTVTDNTGSITVETIKNGNVTDAVLGSTAPGGAWAIVVTQQGDGEDKSNQDVLLSNDTSVGQAIDEQARSLVRVVNADSLSPVVAYYVSGADSIPGQIFFESKSLVDDNFYIGATDPSIQDKYSPELPLTESITAISIASEAQITSAGHGLSTGDTVYIYDTDSTPVIQGGYTVTVVDTDNFTVPVTTTATGTMGFWFKNTVQSDNEVSPNRLYFSKTGLPESVPLLNYIEIGAKDKEISRIIALRDNLFALKEDGIYIVTGSSSPNFGSRLLDSSVKIIAPDSAVVLNNRIYCLTDEGVVAITEAGAEVLSRPIEDRILAVTNPSVDFRYKTFGVSYDSDRAYILFLPTDSDSTVADQAYRYNSITGTWTRWTKDATCGIVLEVGDKLYIGDGSRAFVDEERKNRNRTDYSDRDFEKVIQTDGVTDTVIALNSLTDIELGDAIEQIQAMSISKFARLTTMLDKDSGLDDTDYNSLNPAIGADMVLALDNLNAKLVADDSSGTVSARTFSADPTTQQTEFNELVAELNDVSCDTFFKDYSEITYLTPYEAVVESIDESNNTVTVNQPLPLISGSSTIYKMIMMEVEYQPQHFGDQSLQKQVRQGTFMFDQTNFYGGKVAYASDLSQNFEYVDFDTDGVGDWGFQPWGEFVWGGEGKEVPKRTYIPRQKQRCRFLKVRLEHNNAREIVRLNGISLDPRAISRRAYR